LTSIGGAPGTARRALLAAAAIDDGAAPDDDRTGRARHVHRLAGRAAGRDDVLDDQHFLTGSSAKPRRSVSVPSWRSAKIARTPSARPTSWPITMPPIAGDSTAWTPSARTRLPERRAERFSFARVLKHQRTLEVTGAVQS
jgi:hypothetical protein